MVDITDPEDIVDLAMMQVALAEMTNPPCEGGLLHSGYHIACSGPATHRFTVTCGHVDTENDCQALADMTLSDMRAEKWDCAYCRRPLSTCWSIVPI